MKKLFLCYALLFQFSSSNLPQFRIVAALMVNIVVKPVAQAGELSNLLVQEITRSLSFSIILSVSCMIYIWNTSHQFMANNIGPHNLGASDWPATKENTRGSTIILHSGLAVF